MKKYLLLFILLLPLKIQAQQIVTCGTPSNICYPLDCTSDYSDNVTYTETYTSSNGVSNIKIDFTAFNTEDGYDYLYVYDTAITTDPTKLIATYTGTSIPVSITSTGASLSLKFTSDASVNDKGFKATISCIGNQNPTVTTLSPAKNSNNNAGSIDLIMEFDETVNPVTGKFITIKDAGTNATIEQIDVVSANVTGGGTKKIIVNPSTDLADGTYYVLIEAGAFQDIANVDFTGYLNTTDWVFSVRNIVFDGFAGNVLQLTQGQNAPYAYAEIPHNDIFNLEDEFTIEFWIKLDKLAQDQKIIGKVNSSLDRGYVLGIKDNKFSSEFWDVNGKKTILEGGNIVTNKWTHCVVTWDKTLQELTAYVNGDTTISLQNLSDSWGINANPLRIGVNPSDITRLPVNGQFDEIRIWSEVRTIQEIRENMHLTLTGKEHGLISYWQCNDTDNTILKDEKGLFNASLKNAATKVTSTLAVGEGISETQVLPEIIPFTGPLDFPTTDVELGIEWYQNLFRDGEIVISKINGNPNPTLTKVIAPYTTNYWVIRQYGGGTIDASPTFKLAGFITNNDKKSDLSLFKREGQSHLAWDFAQTGRNLNSANQTVTFGDYTDFNLQFAISRGNPRQLDSLALVSLYNATDGANWANKWNLNLPMTTWVGVKIEDRRVAKLELFENNLVGVLPIGLDALSELRIMNLRSNKLSGTIPADLGNLPKLQVLNLRINDLEGTVPSSLGLLSDLTNLILSDNDLEDLPAYKIADLKNLQLLSVEGNKFTFDDVVPNEGVFPDYVYYPQQKINDEKQIQTTDGANVTIKTTTDGTGNIYQWFKDGDSLKNSNLANSYTIQNFDGSDIGIYHCEVTNSGAPDLTLIRNNITITTTLNTSDSLALVALYNATDGTNWTDKWDLNTPIRTWFGVTLINSSRVETLKLPGNNLVGTLPNELGNLTSMTLLDLGSNEISGTIPTTLGELKKLKFIFLHNNKFTGTVPSELADMLALEVMLLRGNKLIGNLPNLFNKLLQLRRLEIQGNELTGLPNLSDLKKLESLSVENNKLTFGDIEANIGITSDFNYFPQDEIDTREDLSISWMDDVIFTTTVDGTANTYQWKKGIDIIGNPSSDNSFTINGLDYTDAGVYTCEVTNSLVPDLVLIRKSITLQIEPPGVNQTDSLALVALYNATNGANWQTTWNLQDEVETWSGVTLKNGRVVKLNLSSNKLSGTLPSDLGNILRLEELNLQSNFITGNIPSQIGNLTLLNQLNLSINKLIGTVPTSLSQLTVLEAFDLSANKLEGNLPDFWVSLPELTRLNLETNQFTGSIPEEIGMLSKLTQLHLSKNLLEGEVPTSFNKLSKLQSLFLDNNSLTHLPDLSNLTNLSQVSVEKNFFTFEDLEPNINIPNFNYQNQQVRERVSILGDLHQDIILDEIVGGSQNLYQWFKENQTLTSVTSQSSFTLNNATFDSIGVYKVDVTNKLVANLVLSYEFGVKIKPETPIISTPEPYCYGDTVIVLTSESDRGESTRWYADAALTKNLGEANKIRILLTEDRQTIYAVNLASGLESKATAVEIILRPTIEKQGNTLVIDDDGVNYQWHFNNQVIEGENSHILTIGEDGIYNVTLFSKEGCEATSQNIEIKDGQFILALEDDNWENDLQVYPNPSEGILTINLNNAYFGDLTVKIINTIGKELIVKSLQKNEQALNTSIDISDLANGMYILEFTTDTEKFRKKIIKK